jgi:hypothetical protein
MRSSEAAIRGCAQRPVLRGNELNKTGARSARARTRGQNPLVYVITTHSGPLVIHSGNDVTLDSNYNYRYTVKKVNHFPVPSRDVTDQTLPGREKLKYSRPGRVRSATSRPAGDGKTANPFYSVRDQK